jgi:hypothetical protein
LQTGDWAEFDVRSTISKMGAPLAAAPGHAIPPLDTGGHMGASIVHRDTRSGRRLWYRLKVIQQPERARACGSGPKCE